jgi:hypothetical protein
LEAFNLICEKTAQIFQSLDDYVKEPDVASDFFGMCIRYIKLNKDLLFRSQHLEALIKLWINGIGIEHQEAVDTHVEFFVTLVDTMKKDIMKVQDLNNQQEI